MTLVAWERDSNTEEHAEVQGERGDMVDVAWATRYVTGSKVGELQTECFHSRGLESEQIRLGSHSIHWFGS